MDRINVHRLREMKRGDAHIRFSSEKTKQPAVYGAQNETLALVPSSFSRLLKNSPFALREPQDERRGAKMIEHFPFMLSLSKHSEAFFSNLLGSHSIDRVS
jgi:hypothetical protein